MADHDRMVKRQQLLADFGEFALGCEDLDQVLAEACRLVSEALGTGRAKVLEIQAGGQELLVRAGVGWGPGVVGEVRLSMRERSSETFSIREGKPVITRDVHKEDRFEVPSFMKDAGVVALVNVPIFVPGRTPYGLLQVDAQEPRDFGDEDTEFLRTYATVLGPVIDRLLKIREMEGAEERFRLIVESARDYAIFLSDAEDRITDWLPGAEAVFGWTAAEAQGQKGDLLFTEEDRARGEPRKEIETARRQGSAANVRWHLRKDGSRVFIEGAVSALHSSEGDVRAFLKIGQDVTERRARDDRLLEAEQRIRSFADASSDVLWIRNGETLQFEYVSPAFLTVYGRSVDDVLHADSLERWAAMLHPDDREGAIENLKRVAAGERIRHEFRIVRGGDDETRWIQNTDFPLPARTDGVRRIAGIAKDVTDEKASAARVEVLVAELQHRSRNLLGVITAVASKTLSMGGSIESFETRLKALGRAQGLLSQFGSDTVEVGALVRAELAAYVEITTSGVILSGPKIQLTARQVQNFALAIHELTTNAVKYGALREGAGRLEVTWDVGVSDRGVRRLALVWSETGVQVPPEGRTRRGYGRELIERALSYSLGARTRYTIGEDGVRCTIDLPLE